MNLKIKIQDDKKRFVKNKGMHLLNNFIGRDEVKEITLLDSELFILESTGFKHWFEPVGTHVLPEVSLDPMAVLATDAHTIEQLRNYCKDEGFRGFTGMSKSEIIDAINNGTLKRG